jgi:hypothetical protein
LVSGKSTVSATDFAWTGVNSRGGYDQAIIVGTGGDDRLSSTTKAVALQNPIGQRALVEGFEQIVADLRGGRDSTHLIGSGQRDLLRALDDGVEFESTRQMLRVVNAEEHHFEGRGGADEVLFGDFDELDLLEILGDRAIAYLNQQQITAADFEFLEATTRSEHTSYHDIDAVDYLFMLDGNWQEKP